ncbi:MAG: DeoR/GlpR transcriptional regulator [Clostridia bacterium]|nr:DeoR/GlpR transcriptional regulator [Clostridia bacterium]
MSFKERELSILEYVKEHKEATVSELCKALFVSEATMRRDLTKLHNAKKLIRTHGGAIYRNEPGVNLPQDFRERENVDAKIVIAQKCLSLINDGDTVMIDGSSTVLPLLRIIGAKKSLVIITNNAKAPVLLAESDAKVFVCGGELATNAYALVGSYAEKFINSFNADICFFSVSNLTKDGHLTDNSIQENIIRKAMIAKSKKVVLLLDSHKIGEPCISDLCTLDDIDLVVCEKDISQSFDRYMGKFVV